MVNPKENMRKTMLIFIHSIVFIVVAIIRWCSFIYVRFLFLLLVLFRVNTHNETTKKKDDNNNIINKNKKIYCLEEKHAAAVANPF